MTDLNPSYGVPFTMKGSSESPKEVMRRIIEDNPHAKQSRICELFADHVVNDPDLTRATVLMAAINLFVSVERLRVEPETRRKDAVKKREEKLDLQKNVARVVSRVKRGLILDTLLPNGRLARESTGRELIKAGGALAKIGALVKPTQIVGRHVTDDKAQKILANQS